MQTNILICGVGGQGIVLASKLIAAASMAKGLHVMSAETIGMAQKGGSVFSFLRVGDEAECPMFCEGSADLLIAFEPAEAVRMLPYLKKGGKIIVNAQSINPMPVITGAAKYPENIADKISEKADAMVLDALTLAKKAGNIKAVNVVLIGVMASLSEIPYEKWVETIKTTVPEKFLEVNLKAFDLGYKGE